MGKSSATKVLEDADPFAEAEAPEFVETIDVEPELIETVEPVEAVELSYPEGTQLFSWEPKGGGEKLYLPKDFERPDKVWLWDQAQLPFLSQTFRWMERANVPKDIQRKVCSLPDDEYLELFTAWFKAMGGGATPGE